MQTEGNKGATLKVEAVGGDGRAQRLAFSIQAISRSGGGPSGQVQHTQLGVQSGRQQRLIVIAAFVGARLADRFAVLVEVVNR